MATQSVIILRFDYDYCDCHDCRDCYDYCDCRDYGLIVGENLRSISTWSRPIL